MACLQQHSQIQASTLTADASSVLQMIVFMVFFFLVATTVFAVQALGVFCAMVRGCLIVLCSVWVPETLFVCSQNPVFVTAENQSQQVS